MSLLNYFVLSKKILESCCLHNIDDHSTIYLSNSIVTYLLITEQVMQAFEQGSKHIKQKANFTAANEIYIWRLPYNNLF